MANRSEDGISIGGHHPNVKIDDGSMRIIDQQSHTTTKRIKIERHVFFKADC
ncbi:MAG: hypothetical protein AAGF95_05815 [Chloroflexota bacterium]